jgi:guanine deaminase
LSQSTTIVKGGVVLAGATLEARRVDVALSGNRIVRVGPDLAHDPGAAVVDARGMLVAPGLINAHTHSNHTLTRGLSRRWTLEDHIAHLPLLNAGRTAEEQYVSTALGAVEMLRSGCTAVYDLFTAFPAPTESELEAVVRAYSDVGLRAVVAPAVADVTFHRTVPGLLDLLPSELRKTVDAIAPSPTDRLLRLTEVALQRWDGHGGGRIRMAVGPTIPGQCTDDLLAGCARLAREYAVGFHTHLAETKVQVVHAEQRWGTSLVGVLETIGALDLPFVGAHGVWLSRQDVEQLSASRATIAHCPASNLRLGSGVAPVRELIDGGVAVALGSDGSLSSDNQNMFEAMRLAAYVSRIRFPYDQVLWLDGAEALCAGTCGGASALGLEDALGVIEPGALADLVLLRLDSPYLRPLNDPGQALVFSETGAAVDTVIVDGRIVVRSGTGLGVDECALQDEAQATADRIRHSDPAGWELARRLRPYLAQACRSAFGMPYDTGITPPPLPSRA